MLTLASEIIAEFDQILIWIAKVDRKHFASGAIALDKGSFDRAIIFAQLANCFFDRGSRNEANISRAGGGAGGFRIKLMAHFMQVDFCAPK